MDATEEARGAVQAEPPGNASFSIASEEKCMLDNIWIGVKKCCEEVNQMHKCERLSKMKFAKSDNYQATKKLPSNST